MRACLLVILVLVAGCARLPARGPARPAPGANEWVPAVCRKTGQRPAPPFVGEVEAENPWSAPEREPGPSQTIRFLSANPLVYQPAELGERRSGGAPFLTSDSTALTPLSASMVKHLRFGQIVQVRRMGPSSTRNYYPVPPYLITDVTTGPVATGAEVPVLAEWHRRNSTSILVYADGHAIVEEWSHVIDVPLSPAQLDEFLGAFASADFDDLSESRPQPLYDPNPDDDRPDDVLLLCERYQRVDIASHERALAPVRSAFAHLRALALSHDGAALRVKKVHGRVQVLSWPADAPPLTELRSLQDQASSPVYRKLPDDLLAAFPAHVDGDDREARDWPPVVIDQGVRWALREQTCAPNSKTCIPGTYSAISIEYVGWKDAPGWAPDFALIGKQGLALAGKDERFLKLRGTYRQGNAVYEVSVSWRAEEKPPSLHPAPAR